VRPLREDLGHDVDDQESQCAKGHRPVRGLRHHPVSRSHDDPVRCHQADGDGSRQPDEREHPGIEQHETLRSSVNSPALLGHDQAEDNHGQAGNQRGRDFRHVLANRALRPRTHPLAAAGTAGGRWHAYPPAIAIDERKPISDIRV
jgi:hypothetical protein